MVICLERDADLRTAQLMPLPVTVSCFSKIPIGFTFLVPAHLGSPGKRADKWVCVCVTNTEECKVSHFGDMVQIQLQCLHLADIIKNYTVALISTVMLIVAATEINELYYC